MLEHLGWKIHRKLVDQGFANFHLGGAPAKQLLIISVRDPISCAQIYPFFRFRRELKRRYNLDVREISLCKFMSMTEPPRGKADAVLFQTWFDLSNDRMNRILDKIGAIWPNVRIGYLDWFAPTDLRYADVLHNRVSAYVKKNILSDLSEYGKTTKGETNLTDHYARLYNLAYPEVTFTVPPNFFSKLFLGPGFELSPIVTRQASVIPSFYDRSIDLHARMSTSGTEWYSAMRREAKDAISKLPRGLSISKAERVSLGKYLGELRHSKVCFSPFGYGEICWRDFEAMASGAMLLKPDVSHVRLAEKFFVPFETYIPIRWDLGDLEEKLRYFLSHENERVSIARNAYAQVEKYSAGADFCDRTLQLWCQLGLA